MRTRNGWLLAVILVAGGCSGSGTLGDDDDIAAADDDLVGNDDDQPDDDDATADDDDVGGDDDDSADDDDDSADDDDDSADDDDDSADDDDDSFPDGDGDGFPQGLDCDDDDPDNYPGGPDICDGQDNNCTGSLEPTEIDNDGDGQSECDGDCDDGDDRAYPGQVAFFTTSVAGGGYDFDCDGVEAAEHPDNSGYPTLVTCTGSNGAVGGYSVGWYCPTPGWSGNPTCPAIPACGVSADWMEERPDFAAAGCPSIGSQVVLNTQGCR